MRNEYLFYIDFRNNDDRPFYTFVGGMVTTSFVSNKLPVNSEDFTKDYRMVIEGSGVQEVSIALTGILENYQEQFNLLFDAHNKGLALRMKLDGGMGGLVHYGRFVIENIVAESEVNMQNTCSINLINSGKIETLKNG